MPSLFTIHIQALHIHTEIPQGVDLMAKLDALLAEVAETKTVAASAIALLNGLSDALKAAGGNQAEIDAIVADLDAQNAALAGAVTANTPAAEPPAPPADEV